MTKLQQYQKEYRLKHKEEAKKYKKAYHVANKEKIIARSKAFYIANKKDILKKRKRTYLLNKAIILQKNKLYRKHHPESHNFSTSKRRAVQLNRTPKWLTKSDWIEIRWAYKIAKNLTKETGLLHVVDHIIPLQGKNISGLHCPQNLQIITARENIKKKNIFPYKKEF